MRHLRSIELAVVLLLFAGCLRPQSGIVNNAPPPAASPLYREKIQPLFNARCVSCHSCYNAPCQLNLASYDGVDRGANKQVVYHPSRLAAMAPTRLFQDAQSTSEWQQRFGFFPVLARTDNPERNPSESLLYRLATQRREHPESGDFEAEKSAVCPHSIAEANAELKDHSYAGMPYGFPALTDKEFATLGSWLKAGAPGPLPLPRDAIGEAQIERWEKFFNGEDAKTRITARYLYEHLFLAHLHFADGGAEFYRLVRSRTSAPAAIDEIATVRPFDDPHSLEVFYRLRRLDETIVEKTHNPLELSEKKLAHWRALFLETPWANEKPALPSYEPEVAANAFIAFKDIPARSRYQFMLDEAFYHVRAFINGPVCKGQVALNVIDEQFNIFFLSPESDLSITDSRFLAAAAPYLKIPAEGGDGLEAIYGRFKADEHKYNQLRHDLYQRAGLRGRAYRDIWNGDGKNPGAVLTVYRHFDSATVLLGALGGVPKTAWVMDYPIFERIYYDLVAGFNVFGNVIHQTSTRRYMDNLRVESEDGFLDFLPKAQREPLRATWYRGKGIEDYMKDVHPLLGDGAESLITFKDPAHAKEEFLEHLLWHELPAAVVGKRDVINDNKGEVHGEQNAWRAIVDHPGYYAQLFPDVSFVRVEGVNGDRLFTIIRNKAHLNVCFMFEEEKYRVPAEDTLLFIEGRVGAYPNLLFSVKEKALPEFIDTVQKLQLDAKSGDTSFAALVDKYGVRRSNESFWRYFDWFNERWLAEHPISAGRLDLSRYLND